jgi:ribokinase
VSAPGGRVCVVGSANLDLVAATPRLPRPGETVLGTAFAEHPGGKGLNQAVAAARAGGVPTTFVGALGADGAAAVLRDVLAAEGIEAGVATSPQPTGRAIITVDEHGENAIVVVSGANADVRVTSLPDAAVMLTQLEVPMDTVGDALRLARHAGMRTIVNPAPAAALPHELLALVDVLVPNEHELDHLGAAGELLAAGVGAIVTTLGAAGARVLTVYEEWQVAPFPVDVVDTTGAGDAFCGVLAACLARGDSLAVAAHTAAAAGALATTRHGAVPSIPTAAEVAALVARQ